MNDQRQRVVETLEHEFNTATGFVRIHAAEALCEHGYGYKVSAAIRSEVDSTMPGYRVGVWRVMARIATDEAERRRFVDRIRRVMLDETAPDRVGAAESLAKLGVTDRADRSPIERWMEKADDSTAAFPLWLRLLSSSASERAADEARLAACLESGDAIARQRAGFSLGRLKTIAKESLDRLHLRTEVEPADSPARVYLLAAAFLHATRSSAEAQALKARLLDFIDAGKANEQFEVGTVLGMRGSAETDLPALERLLKSSEADGRVGAAGAMLSLLR